MRFIIPALTAAALTATLAPGVAVAASGRLGAGAVIPVRIDTPVSSATSDPEDRVEATVRSHVRSGGRIVIPAGSTLRGHVISAERSGRVKGRARLSLRFTEVEIDGRWHRVSTQRIALVAPSTGGKDAKIIGGGAGAGAIIGAIVDGKEGAAKGALLGAGTGTGVVLGTRGREVGLGRGARWRVRLAQPLVVG
jgi:hypothetical protein